ncbi:MAG: lysophospholipid acyltransferase family protein [Planctomycetota bacterium]
MIRRKERDFRWHRFPPVQLALYLLLRTVIMIVGMFPYSQAPAIARILAWIIRRIDRKHVRIAAKNLEKSRGVCAPDEIPAFIDRVYRHIALGFVEMLFLPRLLQRRALERHVRLERFEILERLLRERGKGVIVTIGHLGNWELIGLAVARAGWRLNSLARPIENPWVDRYLNRFRTLTGQEIISKYHALGAMIQALRRNELLVIQIDQDARRSGVFVNFFGRPASTHRSPALLALKYGTPIVVADIFREGNLHRCVLSDPLDPETFRGRPDPVRALTEAFTEIFEGYVRRHPDQWFWVHDRWKTAERLARASAGAPV